MSRQRPKLFFMWSLIYASISFTWADASHFTLVSLSALYAVFSLFIMLPSGSSQAPKKQDHITPISASRHCLVVRFRIDLYLSVKTFIVWLLISLTFCTPTPFLGASAQLIRFFWLSHTLDSHLEEIKCSPCVPPNYGTAFPHTLRCSLLSLLFPFIGFWVSLMCSVCFCVFVCHICICLAPISKSSPLGTFLSLKIDSLVYLCINSACCAADSTFVKLKGNKNKIILLNSLKAHLFPPPPFSHPSQRN